MNGLLIGRFQPFHLGHLEAVRFGLSKVDKLFIGIGSSNKSHQERNPFTADERKEMITSSLDKKTLDQVSVYYIPDADDHDKWTDSIDNIIGYVHSSDMFKSPKSIKQILLPIHFVPSVITGKELLEKFTEQAGNIAVVSDEYGGTAGMVTLEDVIEEIFGEIEDEHDKDDLLEEKLSETQYRFSARIEIDYINEQYNLNIPESEDYETLGGLVLYELANIPEKNSKLKIKGFTFVVEEVTDRRIETIIVFIK